MALPSCFESSLKYFEESLTFFRKYEHLFNFSNTDILINNNLNEIDIKDLENIDVFDDNFDILSLKSDYLLEFFEMYKRLRPDLQKFERTQMDYLIDAPLSFKKGHEIAYLAQEIDNLCKKTHCDTVVDFGSGLGYLDQHLCETTNYNVLGLECNENNYIAAKKRQRKYYRNSIEQVKYIKHKITEDSYMIIEEFLEDKFTNYTSFCITGLHACADLTIDAINIFLKIEKAKAIIIMPCCYHRLICENDKLKNFPLSKKLGSANEKIGCNLLTVPFLRLASQPPYLTEEKLENSVFNLLARAVIQLYGVKYNCKIKRNKRKAVRLKTMMLNNFEDYIQDAILGFKLINNETDKDSEVDKINFDVEELITIWRQIPQVTFKKAAIFILLQNYLQPVFENVVLYDRVVYLIEKGIDNCRVKKIVNEKISPRCFAILAQK
ncbi:unnamed protein product, partial [Brenthis ino]